MSDAEIQRQRMERILGFSRELTSTVALKPLLQKIVEAVVELTSSEAAGIMLLDERTGQLRFAASSLAVDQLIDVFIPIEKSVAGAAFSSGEPLLVPDVHTDPRFYRTLADQVDFEPHSLLAVPLQFQGRRVGVLEAENKLGAEGFNQEDAEILTALAAHATVAIENARMVEALQRSRDLAEALRQASAALSSTLDYDEVFDRILEQMSHVVPYDAASVMLIEEVEGKQVARIFRGRGYEQFGSTTPPSPISLDVAGVDSLREMQQTGQPLVIPHVERDDEWVHFWPGHEEVKSHVCVPIRVQDQSIGFLNVNSFTPGFFRQADAECLQAFVGHVAIAIENARLYNQAQRELAERVQTEEELRRHRDHLEELVAARVTDLKSAVAAAEQLNEQLERVNDELMREIAERTRAEEALQHRNQELAALNAVTQALSSSLELHDILGHALARAVDVLEFAGGTISLVDERTGDLALVSHTGMPSSLVEHFQTQGASGALCDLVYQEGEALSLIDLCENTPVSAHRLLEAGLRSYVGTPIVYHERVLGAFCLFDTGPHPLSETDHALLIAIGRQMGVAVENTRLFRDVVRERQASYTMLGVAKALSTTLHLDKLLTRALDELQRVVPYDAASICVLRDEHWWTITSRGLAPAPSKRFDLETVPLVRRVVRERGPILVSDVHQESDWRFLENTDLVRSWLGVPLITRDEVIGVLMIDSHHPDAYDEEDARLAFTFAHHVALAMGNSRLYEQVRVKLREMTLLHDVTSAFSSTLDTDQILPYVAHSLCEILNSDGVEIYGLDEDAGTVTVISEYIAPGQTEAGEERRSNMGRVYALADLVATRDALTERCPMQGRANNPDVSPYLLARLRAYGAQATLILPMVVGDRVLGFAQAWERKAPRRFTPGEIATGQTLVHQAASTVNTARLVETLRQRTVELQARNEELDAFAHTVAHDLKSPLSALMCFSGLLERRLDKGSLPARFLDDVQMIKQSGQKINSIIDELLLLASVRELEDVAMEPLDMGHIVAEVQERIIVLIEEYQAEITTMERWPVAVGRTPWVEEVWVNYLSNAIKYGGQPPRVELGATEQENGDICFWVRDNGPGLTPEEQARLFTPFTRLDQVRAKGHGLGLSIARRIVEKMGGRVGVESTPGQGSTFSFILPGFAAMIRKRAARNGWKKQT